MTLSLHRLRADPTDPDRLVLRPFAGGADRPFNTRWRDVIIGETKPDATNTGTLPGVERADLNLGILEVTTPTVLENFNLYGRILARGPLTLRNCKIDLSNVTFGNGIEAFRAQPIRLVDCEIFCSGTPNVLNNGLAGSYMHAIRCDIHDVVDAIDVIASTWGGLSAAGSTVTVLEACYLHDLTYISPDPGHAGEGVEGNDNATHNDCIQVSSGANLIIRGNTIHGDLSVTVNSGGHGPNDPPYGPYGQGVTLTPLSADITDALIEKNWFDYGKNGIVSSGFPYSVVRAVARNNRFGRNFTPWNIGDGQSVQRPMVFLDIDDWTDMPTVNGALDLLNGNVYEDDNTPVPVYRKVSA